MSREKHNKKKHRTDSAMENKNKDDRLKSQLFSETDAKSVEISGYTMGYEAPQTNGLMQERKIPTGVVEVDESVQLPPLPSQQHDSKSNSILRSSQDHSREHVYFPPINRHYQHQPYGHYHTPPDYHHFGHLSHPYPAHHEYQPPHQHHHHHHDHHRHRHHRHVKQVETYDPRWWYMPLNSVHTPRRWEPPEHHYVAPKCYKTSNRQSQMAMRTRESILSPRKYFDCRCEICRPSRKTPRGTKWVVNE